jgi:hypothetical protein
MDHLFIGHLYSLRNLLKDLIELYEGTMNELLINEEQQGDKSIYTYFNRVVISCQVDWVVFYSL